MSRNAWNTFFFKDCEGDLHRVDLPKATMDEFFCHLAKLVTFSDLSGGDELICAWWHGKRWSYCGWQPDMRREFYCLMTGEHWVGYFEQWDH